jgi:hypothetical protein
MPVPAVSSHQADLDVHQEMRDVTDPAGRPLIVGAIPGEPPGFRLRAEVLAKHDSGGAEAPLVHVVTGMPGAGKTQLAAGYARARLAAGWRLLAWVNAADIAPLLAAWARWPTPWGCRRAALGRTPVTWARSSGAGWRLTGAAACSSSTTHEIAICYGLSFRLTVRPTCW